jgi:hypothetical protein
VVNVVFYDRRNDPANLLMDLYLAQSFDGGHSFEPNRRVTTVSSDPTAGGARAGLIGEYIGLAAPSADRVHPVWTDTREGNQDVYTSIVDTTFVGAPGGFPVSALRMMPPSPNPTRAQTTLRAVVAGGEPVVFTVTDVAGRLVRELRAEREPGGVHSAVWDGRTSEGGRVASGVYFVRASAGSSEAVVKLVMLR